VNRRIIAAFVTVALLLPLFALPAMRADAQLFKRATPTPAHKGMSTRTKVVILAGAALLYYLYKKHQAKVAAQQAADTQNQQNQQAQPARMPQLYRSKNGGIYYRDPQGKPIWLTVPSQSVRVPASDVRRYAPDYSQYRGPAPAVPDGYKTQSFNDFDPNALPATAQ